MKENGFLTKGGGFLFILGGIAVAIYAVIYKGSAGRFPGDLSYWILGVVAVSIAADIYLSLDGTIHESTEEMKKKLAETEGIRQQIIELKEYIANRLENRIEDGLENRIGGLTEEIRSLKKPIEAIGEERDAYRKNQWDYKIVTIDTRHYPNLLNRFVLEDQNAEVQKMLDSLGAGRWELVAFFPAQPVDQTVEDPATKPMSVQRADPSLYNAILKRTAETREEREERVQSERLMRRIEKHRAKDTKGQC
jgi:hypothetical protein